MNRSSKDHYYMAKALRLAARGIYSTQPNPRVGCVIVKDQRIIGKGFHHQAGQAHAEIKALEDCADNGHSAENAEIYISLEPCSHHGKTPPCADALILAKPKRVVIAMQDPNALVAGQGIQKLQAQGISVKVGICINDAMQLNRGFFKRMQTGLPFVRVKLATSLDGRIAMQSGESVWITSKAARKEVHRMRLESCAIISGINTVMQDDPEFTVRLAPEDFAKGCYVSQRQPVRIIVDSQNRLPKTSKICMQAAGETWQVVVDKLASHSQSQSQLDKETTKVIVMDAEDGNGRLDLAKLLAYLGEQEMNEVLVEAGGTLAASFIKTGLVDELVVFQSPDIMGASAQAMLNLPEILQMDEKIQFEYQDVRKIGRDLKLTLRPVSTK